MNDHVLALYLHKEYDTTYVSTEARENKFSGFRFSATFVSITGTVIGLVGFLSLLA